MKSELIVAILRWADSGFGGIDFQRQKMHNYTVTQVIIGRGSFPSFLQKMSAAGQEHKHEKLAQDVW